MQSYFPYLIAYCFAAVDFGAGTVTRHIGVPYGAKRARVIEINASVTETFTQTTTPGYVRVGRSGALAAYAEMNMGVAAASASYNSGDIRHWVADWDYETNNLSELILTCVAPTGGTPAGIADVMVAIGWDFIGRRAS